MYYKSKLLYQIIEKNELTNKMRINLNLLELISKQENMIMKDLIFILGISYNSFYKLKNKVRNAVFLNFNRKLLEIKDIVNMIKIELRYLPEYGDRFYVDKELEDICARWNITVNQFLEHIHSNPKHYKFNIQVLDNNKKGFWVGKVTQLSNSFVVRNNEKLNKKCKRIATIMSDHYKCAGYREDFISIAYEKIIEIGGTVEKNFVFDENLQFNILGVKGKYAIINYYHKYCKDLYYEQFLIDNDTNEDTLNFLADNRYNPEKILEDNFGENNQTTLFDVKDFHTRICEELMRNLEIIDSDRKYGLKLVADNLGITEKYLEQNIDEMKIITEQNNTVKKYANGTYIPMYDMDEV